MSNVINSINESFNRKLKESCEPKRGSRTQIKEGEQLNEIAPIIAAAAPMLMQAAGTAIGGIAQGVGQAVANGAQQQMAEDANSADDKEANKSLRGIKKFKANKPQRKEIGEALTDHISFDLNSDVYNALANIAFKYNLKGIDIEEDDFARAFDHFTIRFFDDGGKEDMFEK